MLSIAQIGLAAGKQIEDCTCGCPQGLEKLLRAVAPLKSVHQDAPCKGCSFFLQQPCNHI